MNRFHASSLHISGENVTRQRESQILICSRATFQLVLFHFPPKRPTLASASAPRTVSSSSANMLTGPFRSSGSKHPDALTARSPRRRRTAASCSLAWADDPGLVLMRRFLLLIIPSLAPLRYQQSTKQDRLRRRWHKYVEALPMKLGERNPITRHLEAGCVTNGVWLVMEFLPTCSWQERVQRYGCHTLLRSWLVFLETLRLMAHKKQKTKKKQKALQRSCFRVLVSGPPFMGLGLVFEDWVLWQFRTGWTQDFWWSVAKPRWWWQTREKKCSWFKIYSWHLESRFIPFLMSLTKVLFNY